MNTGFAVLDVLIVLLVSGKSLFRKNNEHVFKDKNKIINNCDGVKYLVDLLNIDQVQTEHDKSDNKMYSIATVKKNINIIDRARRWDILLFKEAVHIKEKNPTLNNGLKASKKLELF